MNGKYHFEATKGCFVISSFDEPGNNQFFESEELARESIESREGVDDFNMRPVYIIPATRFRPQLT